MKSRAYHKGSLYHFFVRGNNKSYIFNKNIDKLKYLKRIERIKRDK